MFSIKKLICILLCLFLFALPCSALSHSTYNGLSQSSSTVQNLISMALNYDNFLESKYVVYQSGQYDYYIVWGDLSLNDNGQVVSEGDVIYIRYYRTDTYNSYEYLPGTDSSFTLTVYDMITTNIGGIGMQSQLFREYDTQENFEKFAIFGTALMFVVLLTKLRKDK